MAALTAASTNRLSTLSAGPAIARKPSHHPRRLASSQPARKGCRKVARKAIPERRGHASARILETREDAVEATELFGKHHKGCRKVARKAIPERRGHASARILETREDAVEATELFGEHHKDESDPAVGHRQQATLTALTIASAIAVEPASSAQIDAFFNFNPVCPAADGLFRAGQQAALVVAGDQNIENYRPLINDVLIRVRTEICVLESFARETAYPFIQEKGIGWVLPLRETSETYLAGVVFMVGANFILLGSTKVVAILSIYADLLLGLPARLLGKLLAVATDDGEQRYADKMDKIMEKQMNETKKVMKTVAMASERESKVAEVNTRFAKEIEELKEEQLLKAAQRKESTIGKAASFASVVGVPVRLFGQTSLTIRQVLEVFDTFCSRYFVTFTVTYVIVKTVHYVFIPDFP